MKRWLASFALLSAAFTSSAAAQTPGLEALTGRWTLTTGPHPSSGCVITGNATATRSGATLNIDLNVVQACADGIQYRAREACVGRLERGALNVSCRLVSAVEGYVADQFSLRVVGAGELIGRLDDGDQWDVPCTWRRAQGALVS